MFEPFFKIESPPTPVKQFKRIHILNGLSVTTQVFSFVVVEECRLVGPAYEFNVEHQF